MKLHPYDLQKCIKNLPIELLMVMESKQAPKTMFIAGGYIRCTIQGEPIADIDVNVGEYEDHNVIVKALRGYLPANTNLKLHSTDNACTIHYFNPPIQIITGWVTQDPEQRCLNLDFTVCGAAFWYDNAASKWDSYCVESYYQDIASKRIVYQYPTRRENPGDSIMRIQKYIKKGFTIDKDNIAGILARFFNHMDGGSLKQEKDLNDKIYLALNAGEQYPDDTHRIGIQARFENWLNAQSNGRI